MSDWKEPEWTYVYNLLGTKGVRPVVGMKWPLRYITAREVQRARIVTTAAAARELLVEMESAGRLCHGDIVPQAGGKTVRLYALPSAI